MLIDSEEALDYFAGRRFSNAWLFAVPAQKRLVQRNRRLAELARGKSVLHLGCADHLELIAKKMREGQYLHKLLQGAARSLIGVDVSPEGVEAMRSLGFQNIYLPAQAPLGPYDLLIASDVIEHVPDVDLFLRDLMRYAFDRIVVTTPNAYRRLNRRQYRGELINTDHRYWFSPFTLAKVLAGAGYAIEAVEFTDRPSRFNLYRNMMLKKYPLQQDGLLIIARKQARAGQA